MKTTGHALGVWRHETDEEREDRVADENTADETLEKDR